MISEKSVHIGVGLNLNESKAHVKCSVFLTGKKVQVEILSLTIR